MTRPRIALLNAAHKAESTERNFRREIDADTAEFHCPSGDLPESFAFDGFVVTGSSASVYWEREWIADLKAWVSDALDRGLPAFGVCYGHQLLADVLGGTVEDMGEYEIGYREVERAGADPLLAGIGDSFTVFTTHSDRVATAPPGARVLAENDYGIHAFRKDDAFGVQFHPEYDMDTARVVTEGKEDALSDARIESVLAGITEENYRAAREATRVFDNFVGYVSADEAERVAAE
jgi:GMP synthase (glutamine-hydrolysing)